MTKKETLNINASIAYIAKVLQNLKEFGKYHPLIYKVESSEESGWYHIYEQPLPLIPWKITYQASVVSQENSIRYYIKGIPLHQVSIQYLLSTDGNDQSNVACTIMARSILPGTFVLLNKMMDAQRVVLRSIEDQFQQAKVI